MPIPLLRAAELRAIEVEHAGATPPLMERAGRAAAEFVQARFGHGRVLVCAGPGNNGGDGFVLARELARAGRQLCVHFVGDAGRLPPDAAAAYQTCRTTSADFCPDIPSGNFSLVVDALFGIGLARPVTGDLAALIGRINAFAGPVLALDIPSGLDGDSGRVLGTAVHATHTLSFIGGKPGLYTLDGPDHCGDIHVDDLGLPLTNLPGALLSTADFRAGLRPRPRNCHKGSHGSLAVIGGAPGMSGAALLAARAGLQLGAGRVFGGLLEALAVDPVQPELMLRSPDEALVHATAIVAGPGMGDSAAATELVRRCLLTERNSRHAVRASADFPLLLDADALNQLAAHPVLAARVRQRQAPTLLTPHPAEAARLLGIATEDVQANRVEAALTLASRFKAHVALKACGTVVATPEGEWRINASGNPGLASAGSGDVLAGIGGALLAQGWPAQAALCGAVHIHGLAADLLVANGDGPIGIAASELIPAARSILNRLIAADA
ncbi:MAG: NAD(P)H-hydrate dehydratase [Rhodocyclales bacterium]|nr:NAD(P)H-hydrate dehydratase [Rhodocyclales bacterium]